MKKQIFTLFGFFLLAGCSSNPQNSQIDPVNPSEVESNEGLVITHDTQSTVETNTVAESEENFEAQQTSNSQGTKQLSVNNEHLKNFVEFDILVQELDLEHYEGVVKSDNRGTRTILFQTADGKKEYKSIFIKNTNRLKIVHFNDEENLLYNKVIS